MNLADPDLEFIDPTPNVHSLFITFDSIFFWTKLAGKAVVRWSKRMYSCAGVCSYEGRGGICDIALSEPLLKLRPRKDLVETLLHEMIHAYLFVVGKDQCRDGHGPNFQAHMNRINQAAGLNISIYHDFHDEVKLYMTHVWRCNGPCQKMKPYFGVVRRSANRAPGPSDFWWSKHKKLCGGTFMKISEPEKKVPVKKTTTKATKTTTQQKAIADITKYINNNTQAIINKNNIIDKENPVFNKSPVFKGGGTLGGLQKSMSVDVAATVRNVWASKKIGSQDITNKNTNSTTLAKVKKRLSDIPHTESPPKKVKTIDDYFKASSILKDVYGKEFTVTKANDSMKLTAVAKETAQAVHKETLVQCPICNIQIRESLINSHVDECLNKDVVEKLTNETINSITPVNQSSPKENLFDKMDTPDIKPINEEMISSSNKAESSTDWIDLTALSQSSSSVIIEPSTSSLIDLTDSPVDTNTGKEKQMCPCCGKTIDKPTQEHLDECLSFFDNNTTIPEEPSTSFNKTIVIDDSDDEFDETQTMNETGTKSPCPCCMRMVEIAFMNEHLDVCLVIKTEID